MDHIPFGDTPMSRTLFYRRVCDLPANLDPPSMDSIIMQATYVWAVRMPAPLGQAVKCHMGCRDRAFGPILGIPRSNQWTYLIRPDIPQDVSLYAELFRRNVSVIRDGGTVALPSPAPLSEPFRRWIEPPRDTFRPSGLAVIASVRACLGPGKLRAVAHVQ
jgi:hypothetical protein